MVIHVGTARAAQSGPPSSGHSASDRMSMITRFGRRRLIIGGLSVGIAGGVLVLGVMTRGRGTPKRPVITVGGDGTPRLLGIPLSQSNLQDRVFRTVGALGGQVAFAPMVLTNSAQESNLLRTLNAMTRAGMFSTNPPPNPYE